MTSRFRFRVQYDDAADLLARVHTDIECLDETMTVQDAPGADINETLRQFGISDGSILPGVALGVTDPRHYGDWTDIPDLRTALDRIRAGEQAFMSLPADIRADFRNDPLALSEWLEDPGNADAAVELGLLARIPDTSQATSPVQAPAQPTPGTT